MPTVPKLSIGYDYTPEYFGEDGAGHHFSGLLDLGLPAEIGLAFEAGYQSVDGDKQSGCDGAGTCYGTKEGKPGFDYWYGRIGIDRDFFGFNLDLSYWYNSEEEWFETVYGESAKEVVIFTVKYGF